MFTPSFFVIVAVVFLTLAYCWFDDDDNRPSHP